MRVKYCPSDRESVEMATSGPSVRDSDLSLGTDQIIPKGIPGSFDRAYKAGFVDPACSAGTASLCIRKSSLPGVALIRLPIWPDEKAVGTKL